MRKSIAMMLILTLGGCASQVKEKQDTYDAINSEMKNASGAAKTAAAAPDAVSASLLPPINVEVPQAKQPIEERFNVALNNVPAQQFFMAIVSGTRYSMLVHPEVRGTISANLKDVTVLEAMDAIREMYGYDYKVEGTRIYVKPLTLQTHVFRINYLTGNRKGSSDIRVSSGSISDSSMNPQGQQGSAAASQGGQNANSGSSAVALTSSKITTTSESDFWVDLKHSLEAIIGPDKEGRSVVISPQSGVIVVRGMWSEIEDVAAYLRASQLSVDRQVVLEAKIIEVQLNTNFQAGVNWASFASIKGIDGSRVATGFLTPGTDLASSAYSTVLSTSGAASVASAPQTSVTANTSLSMSTPDTNPGSLFGLALQTKNFAALMSFLETQGTVHVLSSPRIATLNNQKAVLKVGTDEFFVTNVTSTTTTSAGATTASPSLTVQPFFSGVALDVTPQIDEKGYIILHIHPSVSNVTEVDKTINLGQAGIFRLPLPASTVSETDSVVRGLDGHIVAIGGLMRQETLADRSQLPGVGDVPVVGELFKSRSQLSQKRELVILLKPTVVKDDTTWGQNILESQRRIEAIGTGKGF